MLRIRIASGGWFMQKSKRWFELDFTCRGFIVAAIVVGMAMIASADEKKAVSAEGGGEGQPANSIRLRVVGPDGKPIIGTAIHVSVWTKEKGFKSNQDFTTDASGEVTAPLPGQIRILRIWASKKDHVPLFAHWWPEMQPDGNEIPETFQFDLAKGTKIGGQVTDPEGRPIEGVKVEVMRRSQAHGMKRLQAGTWLAEGDNAVVTDRNGRWELGNVPAAEQTTVLVKLSHPDFIDDENYGGYQREQSIVMPLLRDKTAVFRMNRGHSLSGQITDSDGNPVADAVVVWGDDPYLQNGSQEVRVDSGGHYSLPPLKEGPSALTVIAKGWAPQRRDVQIGPDTGAIDFRLTPGKRLHLHLEDYEGNPVAGAYVGILQWRGAKSLYNHKHPNVLDTKIPRRANEQGDFIWNWAPEDEVIYSFGQTGYEPIRQRAVTANGEIVVVLMQPKLTVRGTITNAVTGKPVEKFKVAIKPADRQRVAVGEQGSQYSKSGSYSIESPPQDQPYVIRVDARGYAPFASPKMTELYGKVELDIQLHPES